MSAIADIHSRTIGRARALGVDPSCFVGCMVPQSCECSSRTPSGAEVHLREHDLLDGRREVGGRLPMLTRSSKEACRSKSNAILGEGLGFADLVARSTHHCRQRMNGEGSKNRKPRRDTSKKELPLSFHLGAKQQASTSHRSFMKVPKPPPSSKMLRRSDDVLDVQDHSHMSTQAELYAISRSALSVLGALSAWHLE